MKLLGLFGASLLFAAAGCGGEPETPATFTNVQEALTLSCVFSACHQGASPAGEMGLEAPAYDRLVNVPSTQNPDKVRVKPNDVAGSYLMDKILGVDIAEGDRMPPTAPLSEARTDLIRRWIEAGAPND